MRLVILFALLFPGQLQGMSVLKWKVEQPHTYMFYNGEYIPLNPPALEPDASSTSILDTLNPFRLFGNIWDSLPSLNPFGSSNDPVLDNLSANLHSAIPSNLLTNGESDSVGLDGHLSALSSTGYLSSFLPSFGWPSFLGGSSDSSYGDSYGSTDGGLGALHGLGGALDLAGGMTGGYGGLGGSFMKRKDTNGPKDKGPVQYYYVPQGGQGGFFRYEIPVTPSPNQQGAGNAAPSLPSTPTASSASGSSGSDGSGMEDPFPCPTYGQWTYNGVYCISLTAVPTWACKPIDLLTTGKLVICRNKIFF